MHPNVWKELLEFDVALLANTIGYIDPTPAEQLYFLGEIRCQTPKRGPMVQCYGFVK